MAKGNLLKDLAKVLLGKLSKTPARNTKTKPRNLRPPSRISRAMKRRSQDRHWKGRG